jgi:hypothetical protein
MLCRAYLAVISNDAFFRSAKAKHEVHLLLVIPTISACGPIFGCAAGGRVTGFRTEYRR